jgi:hypothetical protein
MFFNTTRLKKNNSYKHNHINNYYVNPLTF